jgi:hypothetical protein
VRSAERAQPLRLDTEGRALGEERANLGAEALGRADRRREPLRPADGALGFILSIALEQILDQLILVSAGQQLRRLVSRGDCCPAHQLVRERRDRTCEGTGGSASDRKCEAIAQCGRRLA